MTVELTAEIVRLTKDLGRILGQGAPIAEVPLHIHSRDVDAGGAPELHPAFVRYLGNFQVCLCGRAAICETGCKATQINEHLAGCEPACTDRFRPGNHHATPNRLNRAFRQVRRHNPKAFDLTYLTWGRSWSYLAAVAQVRSGDLARGLPERTDEECAIQWLSGSSMLRAAF